MSHDGFAGSDHEHAKGIISMNARAPEETQLSFKSDLIDLGPMSLRALRRLDSAALHLALDRVVQQTGRPVKSVTSCSSASRID
jgi:hypothetical protein